jgi:hypothetical protein
MDRAKAVKVLHEINDLCKTLLISYLSIDKPGSQTSRHACGYQITIKCQNATDAGECLKPILEKHNLKLKQENGFTILYQQKTQTNTEEPTWSHSSEIPSSAQLQVMQQNKPKYFI